MIHFSSRGVRVAFSDSLEEIFESISIHSLTFNSIHYIFHSWMWEYIRKLEIIRKVRISNWKNAYVTWCYLNLPLSFIISRVQIKINLKVIIRIFIFILHSRSEPRNERCYTSKSSRPAWLATNAADERCNADQHALPLSLKCKWTAWVSITCSDISTASSSSRCADW